MSVQLALTSTQDKYLYLDADFNYFAPKHYTMHQFAIHTAEVQSKNNPAFSRKAIFDVPLDAEYISGLSLEITFPALTANAGQTVAWVHNIGIYCMSEITFKFDNKIADKHVPEYMDMWQRFNIGEDQRKGYNDLIGQMNSYTRHATNGQDVTMSLYRDDSPQVLAATKPAFTVLVPLHFWFCKSWDRALPCNILLFAGPRLEVQFKGANECYVQNNGANLTTAPTMTSCVLWVEYVSMDDEIRDALSESNHFYVFDQVQHHGPVTVSTSTYTYDMTFQLPCYRLMWGLRETGAEAAGVLRYDWWDRFDGNVENLPDQTMESARVRFNSQSRQDERTWMHWAREQALNYCKVCPETRGIYQMHFALNPEDSLVSGAANLGKGENNQIIMTMNTAGALDGSGSTGIGVGGIQANLYMFAENKNYLFIEGGHVTIIYGVL